MNTKGHEKVALIAGIPLLEEALSRNNKSIHAFHLGNWLTDVSQAVDPVAYKKFAAKGKSVADLIMSIIEHIIDLALPLSDKSKKVIYEALEGTKGAISEKIDTFLVGVNQHSSELETFFRSIFLVKGYFKFVHPEFTGQQPRMDFDSFIEVFDRGGNLSSTQRTSADDRPGSYTQYYPHEHLDRPEILPPKEPTRYSSNKGFGSRNYRSRESLFPDLYGYLRDDIIMTAGLLAEVDLEFEEAFHKGIKEDDPDWHITLAKLGHALHQIEDFFAHSNWTELALRDREIIKSKVLPPAINKPIVKHLLDRPNTTFRKRLKKYTPESSDWSTYFKWRGHPNENYVVTGYFDFLDTVVSLVHLTEELWGGDIADPYDSLIKGTKKLLTPRKTLNDFVGKLTKDVLEFSTDPDGAINDPENDIAKSLAPYREDLIRITRPGISRRESDKIHRELAIVTMDRYSGTGVFSKPEIQYAFLNIVVEGARVFTIGKTTVSIYKLIKEITDFITNPLSFLKNYLHKTVYDYIKDLSKYFVKEIVYDLLAARRIGCHSLLAKDHEHAILYEQQESCAIGVHWYIVKTLLRWKSLSTKESNQIKRYVDWLELLEYFLRNPSPKDKKTLWIDSALEQGWEVFKGYYNSQALSEKFNISTGFHKLVRIPRSELMIDIKNAKRNRELTRSLYSI